MFTPSRKELLRIEWRPRPYELALVLLGLVYIFLVHSTHLQFSGQLAALFGIKMAELLGLMYVLALLLTLGRAFFFGVREGFASLKTRDAWLRLSHPYCTLNFFVISLRRAIAIFASIYLFLHLKHVILWINTANYDALFWNLDRWLHAGTQPNIYLMEWLGRNQDWNVLIDWLYIRYFDYKIAVSVFFLLEIRGRLLSERYFLAYTLLWLLGGLGYLVMPTDGPCYAVLLRSSIPNIADREMLFNFPITTDVPAAYVDNYREAKIWQAKFYQERLWVDRKNFLKGESYPGVFYGIAAMPSLHVAAMVMLAVFLFAASSIAGVLAGIFAALIFVGSIFLQWHYAIDGYIGALLAIVICWFSLRVRLQQS